DADLPPQTLTYSLEPGAPPTASIDASGVFTWTPASADAGTTNVITVRVTDDSLPILSDTETFTVLVTRELKVTEIAITNGIVSLTWSSVPGRNYRVQYKNVLTDDWSNLGGVINANGVSTTATNNIDANTRRFYRILQTN
ncbi:MAG: putative Ig domain-containing protein, partial [Verrucomicrobia subdivision 3 bacterium]|nr:putative Ig domain-containing protein [Limisphaerales bacterium]